MERFSVRNCANHLGRLLASKGCSGAFNSRALLGALIAGVPVVGDHAGRAFSGSARRDDLLRGLLLLRGVEKGGDDSRRADRAVVACESRLRLSVLFLLAASHCSLPW